MPVCLGTDEMNTRRHDQPVVRRQDGCAAAHARRRRLPHWPQAGRSPARRHARRRARDAARDRLGHLAAGCAADLVLLDLDTAAFTPLNDLTRQLVLLRGRQLGALPPSSAGSVVYDQGAWSPWTNARCAPRHAALRRCGDTRMRSGADALDAPYREMVRLAASRRRGLLTQPHRFLFSSQGPDPMKRLFP